MEGRLWADFDVPGYRFHPTEEELVGFYLRKKVEGQPFCFDIIKTIDLYRYDPWQLPDLAIVGEREWYFFVPVDKKSSAARRSRLTVSGYWKATGTDKPVRDHEFQFIGLKKTLVFYRGKAPRGQKTEWIMNEYRTPDFYSATKEKDIVLCRIHRKTTSQNTLDQSAIARGGENTMGFSGASDFEYDLMNEGLPYLNESDGEEVMKCTVKFEDWKKSKPPKLEVRILRGDGVFSPWIETWTPSVLLCTPKGEGTHI